MTSWMTPDVVEMMALVSNVERSFEENVIADVINDALNGSDEADFPYLVETSSSKSVTPDSDGSVDNDLRKRTILNNVQKGTINLSNILQDGEQEIHILRRSKSVDLPPSNDNYVLNTEKEYESEMGSREFRRRNEIKDIESDAQRESWQFESDDNNGSHSEDEIEYDSDLDYFDEFERKIDELEQCDFALERAFYLLKSQIEEICLKTEKETAHSKREQLQETEQESNDKSSLENGAQNPSDAIVVPNKEEEVNTLKRPSDASKENDDITEPMNGVHSEEGARYEVEEDCEVSAELQLIATVKELESRFEQFVSHVGDLIQLGALSARHAIRMESWAKEVQSVYSVLKSDQLKLQTYLEEKESEWSHSRHQLQYEIKSLSDQISFLLEECCKRTDDNTKRKLCKRLGDRYLEKPSSPDSSLSDGNIVDLLLQRRSADEQSLALDFARQSKISELKLLVIQQQNYIQQLELQNKEMNGIIKGIVVQDQDEQSDTPTLYQLQYMNPLCDNLSQIADVVLCDNTQYLPDKSTDPETVCEQVFNIGSQGGTRKQGQGHIFDPQKISYIRAGINNTSDKDISEVDTRSSAEDNEEALKEEGEEGEEEEEQPQQTPISLPTEEDEVIGDTKREKRDLEKAEAIQDRGDNTSSKSLFRRILKVSD